MADDGTQPAKQGMSATKKMEIGITVLAVLCGLGCGGGGGGASKQEFDPAASEAAGAAVMSTPPPTPSTPPPTPSTPEPASGGGSSKDVPAAKGNTYTVNDIEVTVTGAAFRAKVAQKYTSYAATEGAKLVIIDYSVKNVGKEPVACLSFADDVTDSSGVSYETTLECNLAVNNWAMDNLNPGLPKKYQACFEVPSGASGFTMHVNCAGDDGYFALGI